MPSLSKTSQNKLSQTQRHAMIRPIVGDVVLVASVSGRGSRPPPPPERPNKARTRRGGEHSRGRKIFRRVGRHRALGHGDLTRCCGIVSVVVDYKPLGFLIKISNNIIFCNSVYVMAVIFVVESVYFFICEINYKLIGHTPW